MKKFLKRIILGISLCALALVLAIYIAPRSRSFSHQSSKLSHYGLSNLGTALNGLSQIAIPKAFAGTWSYYWQVENDFYLLVGWPSTTSYNNMNSGGNGPPQEGLLGIVKEMVKGMASIAYQNGITSCSSAPATGTITGTVLGGDSVSITFATPTHSAPTGYTNAGSAYAKRANMTVTDASMGTIKVGIEWTCGTDGAYVELSLLAQPNSQYGLSGSNTATRVINLYVDSANSSNIQAEMMTKVVNTATPTTVYDAQIDRLNIDNSTGIYTVASVNTFYRNDGGMKYLGYRLGIVGSTTQDKASAYLDQPTESATALTGTTVTYTGASAGGFSTNPSWGTAIKAEGCLDFSTDIDSNPGAECSGLTLATPTAPIIDGSGAFDYTWVDSTMPGEMSTPSF